MRWLLKDGQYSQFVRRVTIPEIDSDTNTHEWTSQERNT